MRLRPADAMDYADLVGILEDMEVAYWLFSGPPPPAICYLEPDESADVGPVYIAETGTEPRPVGGGRLEPQGFSYFVSRPEWGKGYGAQIARLMLTEFRRRRPSERAVLTIRRENRASVRIVERLNFRFAGLSSSNPVMLRFIDQS